MPVFQCAKCGTVENTALGWFWGRNRKSLTREEDLGKPLCCVCAPRTFPDGTPTGFDGTWHNQFERHYLPLGEWEWCKSTHKLKHIKTGESNWMDYATKTPQEKQ
jgi:hypothetical protein